MQWKRRQTKLHTNCSIPIAVGTVVGSVGGSAIGVAVGMAVVAVVGSAGGALVLPADHHGGKPGSSVSLSAQHLSGSRELDAGFRNRGSLLGTADCPGHGGLAIFQRPGA